MTLAPGQPLTLHEPLVDDLGYSLDHLRILAGPVCARCRDNDGEIKPAPHTHIPYYGPVEHECADCDAREPRDQGEDDGGLTFSQQLEVNARDAWRIGR